MFNSKQKTLLGKTTKSTSASSNTFLNAGMKESAITSSENGAKKYITTGNHFVDQFGRLGTYKEPRSFNDISVDMSTLWAINPTLTVMFTLFIRMITRVVSLFDGIKTKSVQRGAGLKHEGIFRMIWIYVNHSDTFWKNINLFISVGSWKDIIVMLQYDLVYNGWDNRILDWDKLTKVIIAGLENPNTSNLVKKYLPQIRTNSVCKTVEAQADNMVAKYICSRLYGNDKKHYSYYRKLKSSGTAHQWQQLISRGRMLDIDFNTVHGRALAQLVSGKFLYNNNLEKKYEEWISSKPIAKFVGYPHELFSKAIHSLKPYQLKTIDAQFMGLVDTAKKGANTNTGLIVVRDTSASMNGVATGTNMKSGDIAKALALFFSHMLPKGHFANSWIEFNVDARIHQWEGSTPCEKWNNDRSGYVGNTNFMSVINLFVKLRRQGISESEFPTGILCISDGEFDPVSLDRTNVETARDMLAAHFSREYADNFKIILWNIPNTYYRSNQTTKFDTYGDVKNVYYFSGYDGAIVSFLTGTTVDKKEPANAEELFRSAMDQEILSMIEI